MIRGFKSLCEFAWFHWYSTGKLAVSMFLPFSLAVLFSASILVFVIWEAAVGWDVFGTSCSSLCPWHHPRCTNNMRRLDAAVLHYGVNEWSMRTIVMNVVTAMGDQNILQYLCVYFCIYIYITARFLNEPCGGWWTLLYHYILYFVITGEFFWRRVRTRKSLYQRPTLDFYFAFVPFSFFGTFGAATRRWWDGAPSDAVALT